MWPQTKIMTRQGLIRKVAEFHVHSEYDQESAYFDVGLIRFNTEITFRNNIWPICISNLATSNINDYIEAEPFYVKFCVLGFCHARYSCDPDNADKRNYNLQKLSLLP